MQNLAMIIGPGIVFHFLIDIYIGVHYDAIIKHEVWNSSIQLYNFLLYFRRAREVQDGGDGLRDDADERNEGGLGSVHLRRQQRGASSQTSANIQTLLPSRQT